MTKEELRDYVEEQRNLDVIPYHVYSTLIDGIEDIQFVRGFINKHKPQEYAHMKASVTIIDDNGNPKGVYELQPSRTYEGDVSTKYVFEFEYNQLNHDRPKPEGD